MAFLSVVMIGRTEDGGYIFRWSWVVVGGGGWLKESLACFV